jgi:hypothetical protein
VAKVPKARKRTRSLPRQNTGDTAEAFLVAGERIVRRYIREGPRKGRAPIDILAFVGLDDVLAEATELIRQASVIRGSVPASARVANLTTGAFYRAFPPRAGRNLPRRKGEALAIFRRELGRRLVSADVYRDDLEAVEASTPELLTVPSERDLRLLARHNAVGDLGRWRDSPTDLIFYGLLLHAMDPEVGTWLREVNDRALDYLESYWKAWLPRIGRRCRSGVSERQLAAAVRGTLAVMELEGRIVGSPTLDSVTVTDPDPELAGTWPLLSLLAEAVFFALTEPVPS